MGFLMWILFGAIAGWLASLIMKTDAQQGALANILIGVLGAVLGGWIGNAVGGQGVTGFNLASFFWAILGAVILLALYKTLRRRPAA